MARPLRRTLDRKLNKGEYRMKIQEEFYLIPEEVFRLGNSGNPQLSHVRARDVDVIEINQMSVIVANGKGISVFDIEGIR